MAEEKTIVETTTEVQSMDVCPPPVQKHNFFRSIMSVDETRVSVLMICLLFSVFFGGYMYMSTEAISPVWAELIECFALCVSGINIIQAFATGKGKVGGVAQSIFGQGDTKTTTTTTTTATQQ